MGKRSLQNTVISVANGNCEVAYDGVMVCAPGR